VLTKHEVEKKVLNYLVKNIKKRNPMDLGFEAISRNLNISEDEISNAIDGLEDDKKIENLHVGFDIWIPKNSDGEKIKKYLMEEKIATERQTYQLASLGIWFLIALFIVPFSVSKGYIQPMDNNQWLIGAFSVVISILIGKWASQKWFFLREIWKAIPHLKEFTWLVVSIAFTIVVFYYFGQENLLFIITGVVASISTTLYYIYLVFIKKSED